MDYGSDGRSSSSDTKTENPVATTPPKRFPKPPKVDGVRYFKAFWVQFRNCAEHNGWNQQKELNYFRTAIKGEAVNLLWDYGKK